MIEQVKIFQGQNKNKMEIIINDWLFDLPYSSKIVKTEITPIAFESQLILTISIWYQTPKPFNFWRFIGWLIILGFLFALYSLIK